MFFSCREGTTREGRSLFLFLPLYIIIYKGFMPFSLTPFRLSVKVTSLKINTNQRSYALTFT